MWHIGLLFSLLHRVITGTHLLMLKSFTFLVGDNSKTENVFIQSNTWRMFCAETVERMFASFHIFNYLG